MDNPSQDSYSQPPDPNLPTVSESWVWALVGRTHGTNKVLEDQVRRQVHQINQLRREKEDLEQELNTTLEKLRRLRRAVKRQLGKEPPE